MVSNILKLHVQTITSTNPPFPFSIPQSHPLLKPKTFLPPPRCSLSSSSPAPPNSKEEAILQAKTCLSTTLQKPLNSPRTIGKFKKLKQPRFRIEIPVIDDSRDSLSQLALEFFRDLPIKRKGSPVRILVVWPDIASSEAATKAFETRSKTQIEHIDITSIAGGGARGLNPPDVAVFLAPETSDLAVIEAVSDGLFPKPVVIFNPKWGFEDESGFGELSGFVGSFEVIYSFLGLEVRGILSKRRGVIFKCVRDGVLSGEKWTVLVEEDGNLKAVSSFQTRPSIGEVENVLYNAMAVNSPITKSAKFLKDLVSNVTGKKVGLKRKEGS